MFKDEVVKFLRDLADEIDSDPQMLRGFQVVSSYDVDLHSYARSGMQAEVKIAVESQRVVELVSRYGSGM